MKTSFKSILIIIVFVECGIVVLFGYSLYLKKTSRNTVLGAATVVPVRKEYLISSPSSELQYFYEPVSNMQQEDQPEWLPQKAIYTINADALNERHEYSLEKPAHVFRIIALGDSFTFGHYVNTADNWTEQLEERLNARCVYGTIQKIEVINLGVSGYDVEYIGRRYKSRGVKYRPDLIVWFESGSGFRRLRELSEPLLRSYEESLTQEEKSEAIKKHDYSLARNKAQEEINQKYSKDKIFEQLHAAWEEFFRVKGLTKTVIATFETTSSQNKAKLKYWTMGQQNTHLYFGVRDLERFDGLLPDGHPNVSGHSMIAQDIYKYLTEHQIITCQ